MKKELQTLKESFEAAGFEYVYNIFPTDDDAPKPPYVCTICTGGTAFYADNIALSRKATAKIMLFTKSKDPELEDQVMDLLDELGLGFTWSESYITDQHIFEITYEIELEV